MEKWGPKDYWSMSTCPTRSWKITCSTELILLSWTGRLQIILGVARTAYLHEGLKLQVAGAPTYAGLSLADISTEAKNPSEFVGTMGVPLSICMWPGQVTFDSLGPEKNELGLVIVSLYDINSYSHIGYIMDANKQLTYLDLVISLCSDFFSITQELKICISPKYKKHLICFPAWRTWC